MKMKKLVLMLGCAVLGCLQTLVAYKEAVNVGGTGIRLHRQGGDRAMQSLRAARARTTAAQPPQPAQDQLETLLPIPAELNQPVPPQAPALTDSHIALEPVPTQEQIAAEEKQKIEQEMQGFEIVPETSPAGSSTSDEPELLTMEGKPVSKTSPGRTDKELNVAPESRFATTYPEGAVPRLRAQGGSQQAQPVVSEQPSKKWRPEPNLGLGKSFLQRNIQQLDQPAVDADPQSTGEIEPGYGIGLMQQEKPKTAWYHAFANWLKSWF